MEMKCIKLFGCREIITLNFWRSVLGEVIASFFYVLLSSGTGLHFLPDQTPSNLHIALTVGLTVGILASAFGEISGGHFNPAVSVALTLNGTISVLRCLFYIIAQCLGSVAGSGVLLLITPEKHRSNLGVLSLHSEITPIIGFATEAILTSLLILTVIASTDKNRDFNGFQAPLAIGLSVTCSMLMGIPYTGASVNPIRAFGPAVIMENYLNLWVYWAGPMAGAVVSVLIYKCILRLDTKRAYNHPSIQEERLLEKEIEM